MALGHVSQIRRFPVKSLQGETLQHADIDQRGVRGDRRWTVRDGAGKLGSGKNTRRFVRIDGLLELRARYDGDAVIVTLPNGREYVAGDPMADDQISQRFGQPLHLGTDGDVAHVDDGPVHLVTTASLAAIKEGSGVVFDWRRTRANLLIGTPELTGFVEDQWLGRQLRLGDQAVLTIQTRMPRCVMVNLPQEDLPPDERMLKGVTTTNDGTLGVVASVERVGTVQVRDPVQLV